MPKLKNTYRCRLAKSSLVSASLLATAIVSPVLAAPSVKFDRFKDRTEVEAPAADEVMRRVQMNTDPVPVALTFFDGSKPQRAPVGVLLVFRAVSPAGWRFLECHAVDALVDAKPFPLPPSTHEGQAISGSEVFESVKVIVPWAAFRKMAAASSIEFRICAKEVAVSASDLADWRELVKVATPSK